LKRIIKFIFPDSFVKKILKDITRSADSYLFNIKYVDRSYYLMGGKFLGEIKIDKYIDNIECIR
jgi:hypothetical protein